MMNWIRLVKQERLMSDELDYVCDAGVADEVSEGGQADE